MSASMRFMKYAGAKHKLLTQYAEILPTDIPGRYIEPFCGTAAVFCAVADRVRGGSFLGDANKMLVETLKQVKVSTETVAHHINRIRAEYDPLPTEQKRDAYKFLVDELNNTKVYHARYAAVVLAVNRLCFNGLMRQSAKSGFNVPWGEHETLVSGLEDAVRQMGQVLREHDAKIVWVDFADLLSELRPTTGDLVYMDSPYVGTFGSYTAPGFSDADHIRVRDEAVKAANAGATVFVANSDCAKVRELYQGHEMHSIVVTRSISCTSDVRGKAKELLIRMNRTSDA